MCEGGTEENRKRIEMIAFCSIFLIYLKSGQLFELNKFCEYYSIFSVDGKQGSLSQGRAAITVRDDLRVSLFAAVGPTPLQRSILLWKIHSHFTQSHQISNCIPQPSKFWSKFSNHRQNGARLQWGAERISRPKCVCSFYTREVFWESFWRRWRNLSFYEYS